MKSLTKDSNFDGLRTLASINSIRNCLVEFSAFILKNTELTFQGCRCLINFVISATPSHCLHHLIWSCPFCYQWVTCTMQYTVWLHQYTSEPLAANGNAAICHHLQVKCFTLHVVQQYANLMFFWPCIIV